MTTGSLFGIGLSGLTTFRQALDVSSQNIVNNATPGYSRQVAQIATTFYQQESGGVVGTGVQVQSISRLFDQFVSSQARGYLSDHEEFLAYRDLAENVDNLLSNSSTNISSSLQGFFNSVQSLQSNAADPSTRNILLQNSKLLVQRFSSMSSQLTQNKTQVNQQISQIVSDVNTISKEIAGLNRDILSAKSSSNNSSPNVLLDQREILLNDLAGLIGITVNEETDGSYDVITSFGIPLVFGSQTTTLVASSSPFDPAITSVGMVLAGNFQEFDQSQLGGQLGGLVAVRDEVILPALSQLGVIAAGLVQSMNSQHAKGVDLNGNLGGALFSGINSLSVQLSRSISNANNTGTGAFVVSISGIDVNQESIHRVSGAAGVLTTVTTGLSSLLAGDLTINGIAIASSSADGVSSVDANASSLAIAQAINLKTAQTGVNAVAEPNVLNLGGFTAGSTALSGTNFEINGTAIVPAGNTLNDIVISINALKDTTGVTADVNGNNELVLEAVDGRNIEISADGTASVGTAFAYFSLTTLSDQVKRGSLHLESSSAITIAGSTPSHAGLTAGTTPSSTQNLTGSDYSLDFDGTNYKLTRLSDNTVVANQTSSTLNVDGLAISLNSGSVIAGDTFLLMPTRNLSNMLGVAITDSTQLAMASPVWVDYPHDVNQGTGVPKLESVLNTTGVPVSTTYVYGNAFDSSAPKTLSPPLEIKFFEVNGTEVYRIFDVSQGANNGVQIGPDYAYTPGQVNDVFPAPGVVDRTPPGTNATYTYDPGYRVSFSGVPKPGDVFSINYNVTGVGDPTNAKLIGNLQNKSFLGTSNTTLQGAYVSLTAFVGTSTQSVQVSEESTGVLLDQATDRLAAISGVNLDEECASLILYQEAYQAAAQIISTASTIFNTLLDIFR